MKFGRMDYVLLPFELYSVKEIDIMGDSINYDKFKIKWKDDVVAEVIMSQTEFKVVQNTRHQRSVFYKPDSEVTRKDVVAFVRRQIFDEHNANAINILKELGMEMFSSWGVFRKTHGISDRNRFWVEFEGESLNYEKDIKTRKILHNAS